MGRWLLASHVLTPAWRLPAALPQSHSRSSCSCSRSLNPQIINSAEKVSASGSYENLLSRGYLKLFLIFLDPSFLASSNASDFFFLIKKKLIFFAFKTLQSSNFPYLLAVSLCCHNLSPTACTEILMAQCCSLRTTFFKKNKEIHVILLKIYQRFIILKIQVFITYHVTQLVLQFLVVPSFCKRQKDYT